MKISQNGIDLIKKYEGLRLEAYLCPAGVWTIGYGHTKGVKQGMKITEEQAEAYLREVLQERELSQYCTVVLGCTHFNYFKDSFRNIFGDGVTLLDGSGGTVNNLHRVLEEKNLLEQNTGDIRYYTSGREAKELRPKYDLLLNRLEKMLQY